MWLPFWIASKNLASKLPKTACAVLGIALGAATVCAVLVVDHNTVIGMREYHRASTGTPDLELAIKDPGRMKPAEALKFLDDYDGVSAVTPILDEYVAITEGSKRLRGVRLIGVRPGSAVPFDSYRIVGGRDLRSNDRGVMLLGEKAAEDAGVKIGDSLVFRRPGVTPTGCVEGKVVEVEGAGYAQGPPLALRVVGILATRYLAARNAGRVAVTTFRDGRHLMGEAPYGAKFWVRFADAEGKERVEEDLAPGFMLETPLAAEVGQTSEERAFRAGVRLAAFMALGLGLFVIFHLLSLSVTEWIRQVGLLGALGVAPRTVTQVFVMEASLLAIAGVSLGVGIGVATGWMLLEADITSLGWRRPVAGFEVPWRQLMWTGAAGFVACLLGAVKPIARVRRVHVIDALEQGEAALVSRSSEAWLVPALLAGAPVGVVAVAWLLGWVHGPVLRVALELAILFAVFVVLLWTLPRLLGRLFGALLRPFAERGVLAWLAKEGLDRTLRRMAGSVSALTLVAAGIVTLHSMTGSLKREAAAFSSRALPGHVYLVLENLPRRELEFLREIPGVTSVVPVEAAFRGSKLLVRGVPPNDAFADGLFAGAPDRPLLETKFREGKGIVVTRDASREAELDVGDRVSLRTLRGPRWFEVLAVKDGVGFFPHERAFALIAEDVMRRVFCRTNDRLGRVTVGVEHPSMEREILSAIERKADGAFPVRGQTSASVAWRYSFDVDRDFILFDVILVMTACMAGLGLLNSLLISGMERKKEIGLLRAIGIERRQVFKLFLIDAAMIGVTSGVLGVLVGIPFSIRTISGLAELSELALDWQFDGFWMLVAVAGLAFVAVVSALLPALRAGRADVVQALKHE